MAGIYILPVADHLTEEEVVFELWLRKQTVDRRESLEDKRRFLRRLFSEDRKSQTAYQGTHNIQEQLPIIETNVNIITEALNEKVDRALVSRLRHYLNRASSASGKDDDERKLINKICEKIEQLLQKFQQQIRYDPPNPNEKENNSAEESVPTNLSWRTIDPKSTNLDKTDRAQNEKQQSSKNEDKIAKSKNVEKREDAQLEAELGAIGGSKSQEKFQTDVDENNTDERLKLSKGEKGSSQNEQFDDGYSAKGAIKKDSQYQENNLMPKKVGQIRKTSENKQQRHGNFDDRRQHDEDVHDSRRNKKNKENYILQDDDDGCQDDYHPHDDNRSNARRKKINVREYQYDDAPRGGQVTMINRRGNYYDDYQQHSGTRDRHDNHYEDYRPRNDDRRTEDTRSRREERYSPDRIVGRNERVRHPDIRYRNTSDLSTNQKRPSRSISSYDSEYDSDRSQRRQRERNIPGRGSHGRRHRRHSSPWNRSSERFQTNYRKSRVENWDLSFSGDSKSIQVEDFLNRIKKLAHHEGVSDRELLRNIHHRLKGEAYDWWFTREDRFTRWEKFEDEIRFRYGNPNRDRGIRAQIRELKQRKGETFIAYVTEVEKLNQCLQRPFSSNTLFELIWENMRPHYRSKLSVINVDDLEHLIRLNHRIDANDPSFCKPLYGTRSELHHIKATDDSFSDYTEEDEIPIQAIQRKQRDLKEPIRQQQPAQRAQQQQQPSQRGRQQEGEKTNLCWNCQKPGHGWRACTERKLVFCYACGKLGRTTRTCENNHPRNGPDSTN